jgi:hypothetical protein
MTTEHSHVMGGSTAAQRIHCPGSFKLESSLPEGKESSDFAVQGSVYHAAMELLLIDDPDGFTEAQDLLDDLVGQDMGFGEQWKLTKQQIDAKIVPALQAWFDIHMEYGLTDWMIEQRVSLESIVPGAFGTADIVAIDSEGRLHILDWKFGDGVVVAVEGNMGLGFYAGAAIYDKNPELEEMLEDFKSVVVLHIVQPRVGSDKCHFKWETTVGWVDDLVDLAESAIKLAQGDNPPLKPGDWCRWCDAKPICPAQKALASEALSNKPEGMTAIELSAAIKTADQLKLWIAAIYEKAQLDMEKGVAVPGYKLVNKLPRRVWAIDEAKVIKALRKAKLRPKDLFEQKLITPTALENEFPKVYSKVESSLVASHSSGLTVVPDTDRRQAVTSTMALLTNALPPKPTAVKAKANKAVSKGKSKAKK